jgi:hypothetical protein
MSSCEAHPFEHAAGTCRSCGQEYCTDCLVYAFGPAKAPYCVPCALEAAGVRKSTRRARAGVATPV